VPHSPAKVAEIDRLYRQHGAGLVLFAISICGERSRAQDAVHQVFLKLLEAGDLGHASDAKAYLFASVRNTVLNDIRARHRDVVLDDSAWFDPPQRDHAAELNLRRALRALPADQQEVIILHVWCELTFAEVGDVLGISLNTAASRYRYALSRLREAMCIEEHPCEK